MLKLPSLWLEKCRYSRILLSKFAKKVIKSEQDTGITLNCQKMSLDNAKKEVLDTQKAIQKATGVQAMPVLHMEPSMSAINTVSTNLRHVGCG